MEAIQNSLRLVESRHGSDVEILQPNGVADETVQLPTEFPTTVTMTLGPHSQRSSTEFPLLPTQSTAANESEFVTHHWHERLGESPDHAARRAAKLAQEYYDRAHAWRFDPLHDWNQLVAVLILVVLSIVVFYFRRRILVCIFGDGTLHIDRFYIRYWCCLRCCGFCDGEWTRYISNCCCCCCPALRGRNLKQTFGEWIGIAPVAVRIQNIVVGGLPNDSGSFFNSSMDLFVQVIPDELQPVLNTEVISEAESCVQFTTSLTLLLKDNTNEDPVWFSVKQMRLAGSSDVADCYIPPSRLVAWARNRQKVRVQLGGASRKDDPLATPWILMDLSVPLETTYLKHQKDDFNPILAKAQTNRSNAAAKDNSRGNRTLWGYNNKSHYQDMPLQVDTHFNVIRDEASLRKEFPLVNEKGKPMDEPFNPGLDDEAWHRRFRGTGTCTVILVTVVYLLVRSFTCLCFEEYRALMSVWLYAKDKEHLSFDNNTLNETEFSRLWTTVAERCHLVSQSTRTDVYLQHAITRPWEQEFNVQKRDDLRPECSPSSDIMTQPNCSVLPEQLGHRPWLFYVLRCPSHTCWWDDVMFFTDLAILGMVVAWCIACCYSMNYQKRAAMRALTTRGNSRDLNDNNKSNNKRNMQLLRPDERGKNNAYTLIPGAPLIDA